MMIRVDIESVIMSGGSVPSLVVLCERASKDDVDAGAPLRRLSIQTGPYEAAAIGRGVEKVPVDRPITHDLFISALDAMGARLERVEINAVDDPVFFSRLVLTRGARREIIDARPTDALSLAVRAGAPVYVEEEVMNQAAVISLQSNADANPADDAETARFDRFVRHLTPDDF